MEQNFRALVAAAVAAHGGVIAGALINFVTHPQGAAKPYAVLHVTGGQEGLTMVGPDWLIRTRVQIDFYAPSYAVAKTFQRAVHAALHGYRGGIFRLIEDAGSRDFDRVSGTNEAERLHRVGSDFIAHWRRT